MKLFSRSHHRRARLLPLVVSLLCQAFLVLAGARPVLCAEINVPSDQPTIQAALSAASSGDIIRVAPGTYAGSLQFGGKDLRLESTGGPAVTTIQGSGGTAIEIGPAAALIGFTVTGGQASFGGGMAVRGAGTLVRGNIFEGNSHTAGGSGAAIDINVASPVIERNVFRRNSSPDTQFSAGVVSVANGSAPRIVNNLFHDNETRAISATLPASARLEVLNNTIVRNRVGISVISGSSAAANIYRNNLVAGNGVGLEFDTLNGSATTPTFDHNLVFGNTTDYDGIGNLTGTSGNISAAPGFAFQTTTDFRLPQGSPAIDAGSNEGTPAEDYEGTARPADGNGDGVVVADIGADEFDAAQVTPTPTPVPTATPVPAPTATAAPTATPVPPLNLRATLNGAQQVPPQVPAVVLNARGAAFITVDAARTQINVSVSSAGLSGVTGAHIHFGSVGAAGPVIFDLAPAGQSTFSRSLTPADFVAATGGASFTSAIATLRNGDAYIDLHTTAQPRGAIRGQILPVGTAYQLSLSASRTAFAENAGSTATTLTLTRNTSRASAVTVALTTDQPGRVRLPRSVTFGAGQASATFAVGTLDDAVAGGSTTAIVRASVSGFSAQTRLSITDNEVPHLSLSLSASTVAENARGPIMARLRRNTPLGLALRVFLASSDTTEVVLPASVVIPANAALVEFPVTPRDDLFADGAQRVTITARAAGFARTATAILSVADNERPTLTLTISPGRVAEGGAAARATLRRNSEITSATGPLTVTVAASAPGQVSLPATVTIPARATQITFPILAFNDAIAEGPRLVTLTARANNFVPSSAALSVSDNDATSGGSLIGSALLPSILDALPVPSVTLR